MSEQPNREIVREHTIPLAAGIALVLGQVNALSFDQETLEIMHNLGCLEENPQDNLLTFATFYANKIGYANMTSCLLTMLGTGILVIDPAMLEAITNRGIEA